MSEPRLCPGFGSAEGHCGTRLRKFCDPCTALLGQRVSSIRAAIASLRTLASEGAGPWATSTMAVLLAELDRMLEGA